MGWCPSNQVGGPAKGYGTMSRESKCEAILSVDKLPSTLNLEFKGLVNDSLERQAMIVLPFSGAEVCEAKIIFIRVPLHGQGAKI